MAVHGAHCPICLDGGPDYTLEIEERGVPTAVTLDMTCFSCKRKWRWMVRPKDEFPRYKMVERLLTDADKRGEEIK